MIHAVAGTRPEIIKLAPVVRWLRDQQVPVEWLWTGQSPDLAAATFDVFGETPENMYELRRDSKTLTELNAVLATMMDEHLSTNRPEIMLVQGDTLSASVAAQCSFLAGVPVGHVEAGLRTYDLTKPFPEEAARVWIDAIARWQFAPTERAVLNLTGTVYLTGNTVVDALRLVKKTRVMRGQYVVVTMHRRESLDDVGAVCGAVKEIIANGATRRVIWVAHPNPAIREVVDARLGGVSRVKVIDALPYDRMVNLIGHAQLVITDSGGLQEECLALSTPVLVTRESTERPEGVEAGGAILVGTDPNKIIGWATYLLGSDDERERMRKAPNPYGDGHASSRIGRVLKGALEGRHIEPDQVLWKVKT